MPTSLPPVVDLYGELRGLAGSCMRGQRADHTLQPTALLHEAWLRLRPGAAGWESRAHLFGSASRAMRAVLADHARARCAIKRGGEWGRTPLDDADDVGACPDELRLHLEEALARLARAAEDLAPIAELRLLAGLELSEIAAALGLSERKVERGWRTARAFLRSELSRV